MLKKYEKKILISSLLLSCAGLIILLGFSKAWFFDSIVSSDNVITTGSLEVSLNVCDDYLCKTAHTVADKFNSQIYGSKVWQPNDVDIKYYKVSNSGSLALNFQLSFSGKNPSELAKKIDVYSKFVDEAVSDFEINFDDFISHGSLFKVIDENIILVEEGLEKNQPSKDFVVILHMQPDVGNEFTNTSTGNFNVILNATQKNYIEKPTVITTYNVNNLAELLKVKNLVNTGQDNFKDKLVVLSSDIDLDYDDWQPIGSENYPFSGSFDGQNHIIKNLRIDSADIENIGLFGKVVGDNSYIKNLTIKDIMLKGKNYVGPLVGQAKNVKISNINIDNIRVEGCSNYTGGIVGALDGSITDSKVSSLIINLKPNLSSEASSVGGIVGYISKVDGLYSNLIVSDLSITANNKVGGIIGESISGSTINDCHVKKGLGNGSIVALANLDETYVSEWLGYPKVGVNLKNCNMEEITVRPPSKP